VAGGAIGNVLYDNLWFDPSGNEVKSQPSGSEAYTKTALDGLCVELTRLLPFKSGGTILGDVRNNAPWRFNAETATFDWFDQGAWHDPKFLAS
jgi:hypothetical protein